MKTVQRTDEVDAFIALAHPVRRQILDLLRQEASSVKTLAQAFEITRPAVSQHLKILLEAQLVICREQGRENFYELRPEGLQPIRDWFSHYETFWGTQLDRLGDFLESLP